MSVAPLAVVPDFWHRYDDSVPSQKPDLRDWTQVWLYDESLGPVVGFWTGDSFRLYDKTPVKATHWACLKRPGVEVVPDFWHRYDDSTPTMALELEEWALVWICDETLGVNVGFWTGHSFRLYDKTPVTKVTHWAYLRRPPGPPAVIERRIA